MLYANVLRVSIHQNHHRAPLLQNLNMVCTVHDVKFNLPYQLFVQQNQTQSIRGFLATHFGTLGMPKHVARKLCIVCTFFCTKSWLGKINFLQKFKKLKSIYDLQFFFVSEISLIDNYLFK